MSFEIKFFENKGLTDGLPLIDSKNGKWQVEISSKDFNNLPDKIEEWLGNLIYEENYDIDDEEETY